MRNNYLIPANTKKSQLIFGFFTTTDLILFSSGCGLTLLLLILIPNASFTELVMIVMPAVITGFLVMPVMHYHNVLQLITNIINFFTKRRTYYWKGWCVKNEYDETK